MSKGLVFKALVFLAVMLALVAARVLHLQRSRYLLAERHYAGGDLKLAAREYGTALKLHVPLSPYGKRSASRLWEMGARSEAEGELARAQAAYSTLRGSYYGSRSFYTPGKEWIAKCDERLASVRAAMLLEEGRIAAPEDVETTRAKHLKALRADRAPSPLWAALSWVFFVGFLASVAHIIFRGFDSNARIIKKHALLGLEASAAFFVLWALSLMLA